MKRTVLILVSDDPRTSGRTTEAVRVAAGLSVHERLEVTLCLHDEAVQILTGDPADLVDGDSAAEFLAVMTGAGRLVLVAGNLKTPMPVMFDGVEVLSDDQLKHLIATSERVLRF